MIREIVQLRQLGYRFIALADDNFYPVTLADLALAERQNNAPRLAELQGLRAERFEHFSDEIGIATCFRPHRCPS